jgi:type III pantothenate kinase
MILELDLGNTRAKWRLLDDEGVRERGVGAVDEWLQGQLPSAWPLRLERVRIASVLRADIERQLAARLGLRAIEGIAFARSAARCGSVRNGYAEPGRLGVDRWLGIVAAWHEFREPLLVVSAGSALTLDRVDGDGQHLGGFIIPGPRLMRQMLLSGTDRVRFDAGELDGEVRPGTDTGACVHNGIALALVGAIELARRQQPSRLVLTGGYGEVLRHMPELAHAEWRPELVFQGLHWVLA